MYSTMWLLHSLVPRHSHICCFSTESGESLVQYKGPKFAELQVTIHISWKQQIAGEGGGGGGVGWVRSKFLYIVYQYSTV